MFKQLKVGSLSLIISFLFTFCVSLQGKADHENHSDQKSEQSVVKFQDPAWANTPYLPNQESKSISHYALRKQLQSDSDKSSDMSMLYLLVGIIAIALLILLSMVGSLLTKLSEITGEKSLLSIDFDKINSRLFLGFLFLFFGGIAYEFGIHKKFLLPESASEHGVSIDSMFNISMVIIGVVFILTHILLFWFAFKYKYDPKRKALYYPQNDKLEIAWTTIPAIALTILVLFGFKTWNNTMIFEDPNPDYEVELYAFQFGWKFRYAGADGKLGKTDYRFINADPELGVVNPLGLDLSDPNSKDDFIADELRLPKGVTVKLHMRSQDVLHSAFLPHFRVQMYCVPGTPTEFTIKPIISTKDMRDKLSNPEFTYELACNQICGASHFNMRREIIVDELAVFEQWVSEQKGAFSANADNSLELNNLLTSK